MHWAQYRLNALGATHLYILFHQRISTLDLRPCVSRGVAPISTYCPYRARYLLNPVHGGKPRVSFTAFTIPWAEIPLPLQGAAVSKPPNNEWVLRIQNFHVLPPCRPPLTANFMQCFDGFGLVAPCKGNGISAQGKAGRRTATPWVPPMNRV